MIRLVEIGSWLLLMLLGAVFIADGWAAITVPYLLLLGLAIFLRLSVRVVNEYDRLVVLRMGRCIGAKGPGPILVLPLIDSFIQVDTREQYREIPHESCITKDNARIDVDFLLYYKVKDPELQVTQVQNLQDALGGLATGLLRAVIGDISLDDALAEREHINLQLRQKIDEITERWGVEVTTVEIREILMPPETQEVMNREMAAERSRRATILESEGYKAAQLLRAEGEASALLMINDAARQMDQNTLIIKYLETLGHIGDGQATKYVLPMELTGLAQRVTSMLGHDGNEQASTPSPPPDRSDSPDVSVAGLQLIEALQNLTPEQVEELKERATKMARTKQQTVPTDDGSSGAEAEADEGSSASTPTEVSPTGDLGRKDGTTGSSKRKARHRSDRLNGEVTATRKEDPTPKVL